MLVVGVAILREDRVLAARRTSGGWEFPGGKVELGEDPAAAAVREVAEELGCVIEVTGWLEGVARIREGLDLRVATALLVDGEPSANADDHDELRWLPASEIDSVDWLEADRPFVADITARLVDGPH